MGQAKRRGTYEQRVIMAQSAQRVIDKTFPDKPDMAQRILRQQFGGNKLAFATEIVKRHKEKVLTEQAKSPIHQGIELQNSPSS